MSGSSRGGSWNTLLRQWKCIGWIRGTCYTDSDQSDFILSGQFSKLCESPLILILIQFLSATKLYVNKDRSKTEDILRRVAKAGYKSVWVTVDAPVAGKRERDERTTMDSESASDGSMRASISAKQGIAQSLGS